MVRTFASLVPGGLADAKRLLGPLTRPEAIYGVTLLSLALAVRITALRRTKQA